MSVLTRLLSYAWPVRVARAEGKHGPLVVRWETGELVINSERGNQSHGNLHRVWQKVFERIDLPSKPPTNVLLLGLGGGSVPRILRDELHIDAPIVAVEDDPLMVSLARQYFGLDGHGDLEVVLGDALLHVHADKRRYDLVVVDLFSDLDLARGVITLGFAQVLRQLCSGTLCFNTVAYDGPSAVQCELVATNLRKAFSAVVEMRLESVNRVFIGR